MKILQVVRNRGAALTHDVVVVPIAWFGAYWLRFNLGGIPPDSLHVAIAMLPIVIGVQSACFWYFGLYRGMWRFASLPDLVRIAKAVLVGSVVAMTAIFFLTRMQGIPRSVMPLYGLLLLVFVGGPRFLYRWHKDRKLYVGQGKRALIIGAGSAGEMLVRDLLRDPNRQYEPIGFIDDDRRKRGREIHGIRVLGDTGEVPALASDIDVILIALPSARSRDMRRIVDACEHTGVPFRTLPKLEDLVTGRASIKALRDVNIDDLLGREAVRLEWDAVRRSSRGRRILVTGAGGSIGSELCRQIIGLNPSKLIVLERSEFNLYTVESELRRTAPQLSLVAVLGDAGDPVLAEKILAAHRPEIVFHAAAYKHVPMLEGQVRSGIRNNILVTRTLARLVDRYECSSFILISTDKAVNPSNVMGATKLVAESYCQSLNAHSKTRFITVRFGNVLGSAGSVIPLFQRQILQGGPVTVTDPNITRYFMTTSEAAQLILQASSVGEGGEILVLDMGEPVNIRYLAEQLILLSGKKPGDDIEIVYTGLRPGEKLHEELFHEAEALIETPHPKTLLARSRRVDLAAAEREIDAMVKACADNDEAQLRALLAQFVEMTSQNGYSLHQPVAQVAGK